MLPKILNHLINLPSSLFRYLYLLSFLSIFSSRPCTMHASKTTKLNFGDNSSNTKNLYLGQSPTGEVSIDDRNKLNAIIRFDIKNRSWNKQYKFYVDFRFKEKNGAEVYRSEPITIPPRRKEKYEESFDILYISDPSNIEYATISIIAQNYNYSPPYKKKILISAAFIIILSLASRFVEKSHKEDSTVENSSNLTLK